MFSPSASLLPEPWTDKDFAELDLLTLSIDDSATDVEAESRDEHVDFPTVITSESDEAPLTACSILQTIDLPEYPKSEPHGVAYVVNIQGMPDYEVERMIQNVQYRWARKYPKKGTTSVILDRASCFREVSCCNGVKICEFLDPEIRDMDHLEVTNDMWQAIREIRDEGNEKNLREAANKFVLSIKKTACQARIESCKWSIVQVPDSTSSGSTVYGIRCVNQSEANRDHLLKPIPVALLPKIAFLAHAFQNNDLFDLEETCGVILQSTARRRKCGVEHVQGQGNVLSKQCEVAFNILRPWDMISTPYIIFTSHGIHSHPPPPPSRTPEEIYEDISTRIIRLNDRTLSFNTLLRNPTLQLFCEQLKAKVKCLAEIRQNLVKCDNISALLYKQQLFNYSDRDSIAGVEIQYRRCHKENPSAYIQSVYNDGINFIVICFFQHRINLLTQLESFELNIEAKRLRKIEEKELVLTGILPGTNKVTILARIYINRQTAEMYRRVFEYFFQLLEQRFQIKIRWQHLHDRGLQAIVMDQDAKQLAGFGKYLTSVDRFHRHWRWQVQRSVMFNLSRFQRGVEKLVGSQDLSPRSMWSQMMSLLECKSKTEYMDLCDLIIAWPDAPKDVSTWALNKESDVIASGYNKFCSKIDPITFERLRKTTSAVEATPHIGNSKGQTLSLLAAIEFAESLDAQDLEQQITTSECGESTRWRERVTPARIGNIQQRSLALREPQSQTNPSTKRTRTNEVYNEHTFAGNNLEVSLSEESRGRSRSRRRIASPTVSPTTSPVGSRPPQTRNRQPLVSADLVRRSEQLEIRFQEAEVASKELENKRLELENMKLRIEIEALRERPVGRSNAR